MSRSRNVLLVLALVIEYGHVGVAFASSQNPLASLPMRFEANVGQADSEVKFLSHGNGYSSFLTPEGLVMALSSPDAGQNARVLRIKFLGSNEHSLLEGMEELPGRSNYFRGQDPRQWHTGIAGYAKVRYTDVYPAIDLVYYGNGPDLEYDFAVAAGAKPDAIRAVIEGADGISIDANGDLSLVAGGRALLLKKPVAYQELNGVRHEVAAKYILKHNEVRFQLGSYDRTQPLVIDPALTYSTYLGGKGNDQATGIAVDAQGSAYVTGTTTSLDFPSVNPITPNSPASSLCQSTRFSPPCSYVFVSKISADGSTLLYSSYVGGGIDSAAGIAVDAQGNAYVAGTSPGPTGIPTVAPIMNQGFAFIFKLNPTGSTLIYSTHFGSSDSNNTGEFATGIAVTAGGEAYVTGSTGAPDFPTLNPITPCINNSSLPFVSKFNAAGSALVFSTCLSGPNNSVARGIAVDSSGNAYVTGQFASEFDPNIDAFVQKLSATGALIYSKRLGGSQNDMAFGIAADSAGNAYVTGNTRSTDFPVVNAFQPALSLPGNNGQEGDAFVAKLSPSGTILYSTLFGGTGSDLGYSIAVDKAGDAFVAGYTTSTDLPTNAIQPKAGGSSDAFVMELDPSGSTAVFSSYLGGDNEDRAEGIALDGAGNIYVTGFTSSANFPTLRPLQATNAGAGNDPRAIGGDVFITKIQAASAATPLPSLTSVSPNTAVAGSSFLATVSGQNLDVPSSINFSGSGVSATVQPGSTSTSLILSINTTGAAIGSYLLSVSTSSGIATLARALTVQAAPVPGSTPLPISAVETGPIRSGFAIITPVPGSPAPLTTLTYGMVGAGMVESQAAILPTALTAQTTLPVNIVQSAGRNLGVALANPSNSAALVALQLFDQNGTASGPPASISLPAGQQLARFLSELYPSSTLGAAFQGSLNVQSAVPVSIIGLSFSGVEFSTVPILPGIPASVPLLVNGTVGGANAIMFPQFAMGGGWATELGLVNATSVTLTGRIDIFDTSGKPMSVQMNGTTQSTFTYSIAPNGMFLLAPRDSNGQSPF